MYRKWPEIESFTHLSIVQDLPPRKPSSRIPSTVASAATSAENSLANSIADLKVSNPGEAKDNSAPSSEDEQDSDHSTPPTSADDRPPAPVNKGYTGHGPFPYVSERLGYTRPKSFAQPIVFFNVNCLARFGASPVAVNLTHLRLRVPSREIAKVITGVQNGSGRVLDLFPSLRYLDLSTTNVRLDAVLSVLLRSYPRLEHIVLDRVNLFGFKAKDKGPELCRELGNLCIGAGLARGKDRERAIVAWEVAQRTRIAQLAEEHRQRLRQEQGEPAEAESVEAAAARTAREAEEERERAIALARSRRGHRSAAHSTFSLRDRPLRTGRIGGSTLTHNTIPLPPPDKAYFVLPPLPTLKTVSIGGEAHHLSPARVAEWENDFHAGWREGLGKLYGWATHVAEKYERAKKKADEWFASEVKGSGAKKTVKGKAPAVPKSKPPTDIRLYRFVRPDEPRLLEDPEDPTIGLIEVHPVGREYLESYKLAIADAELYATSFGNTPPCVFCTIPDCEGPARKGDEGERVDGRGGMTGKHRNGCGHLLGRRIWGWNGDM